MLDSKNLNKLTNQLEQAKNENQENKNRVNELEQDLDAFKYALKDQNFFGNLIN